MPTISVENYLKAIYHLDPQGESLVKNKAIAERLEISLPSVTAMLKSLSDEDLVSYTRYKGVSLTPEGRSQALKVIRKHRLIELFLVDTLGYSWDEVHIEAERLEHAVSDDLASRIEEFLGHPRVDPHGDPIPTADGQVLSSHAIPLSQCSPPCSLSVERVLDQSPDLLRYLKRLRIMPGEIINVTHIQGFDGQVSLHTTGSSDTVITLTQATASRILVAAVSS
jgi:DtxR family Mn-dependent transcriptional regulator